MCPGQTPWQRMAHMTETMVPGCVLAVAEVRVPLLAVRVRFRIPACDPDSQ